MNHYIYCFFRRERPLEDLLSLQHAKMIVKPSFPHELPLGRIPTHAQVSFALSSPVLPNSILGPSLHDLSGHETPGALRYAQNEGRMTGRSWHRRLDGFCNPSIAMKVIFEEDLYGFVRFMISMRIGDGATEWSIGKEAKEVSFTESRTSFEILDLRPKICGNSGRLLAACRRTRRIS
jgi:hypothetical protein